MRKSKSTSIEEQFVNEYLVDYDGFLAAIRIGTPRLQAKKRAEQLLGSQEVQAALAARVDAMRPGELTSPSRLLFGMLREVGRAKWSGDRLVALKQVHEMLKDLRKQELEEADAAKAEQRGGVMVVPGTPSLNDWEKAAAQMQKELKDKVKE